MKETIKVNAIILEFRGLQKPKKRKEYYEIIADIENLDGTFQTASIRAYDYALNTYDKLKIGQKIRVNVVINPYSENEGEVYLSYKVVDIDKLIILK